MDIVAPDIYNDSARVLGKRWDKLQEMYGGRKMVGLAETKAPPNEESRRKYGARWLWFSVWSGDFIKKVEMKELKQVYYAADVVTLDEVPRAGR